MSNTIYLCNSLLFFRKPDDPVTWKVVESGTESQQIVAFGCDVDRVLIEIPENTQLGCG